MTPTSPENRPVSREDRYYAAVHADTAQRGARAAMALADAEMAEVRANVEALAAWFEGQPNWREWGVHRQIRAALRGDLP